MTSAEVFVLRYNVSTVVTWILCGRRLRVHKDMVHLIAKKYLLEKRFHFSPQSGISYSKVQLEAYRSLNKRENYTFVDTEGVHVACIAGIAALELLNGFSVVVMSPYKSIEKLINEMAPGKSDKFNVTLDTRGLKYDLIILDEAHNIMTSHVFMHQIMPVLYMQFNVRMLIFGNMVESPFLRHLTCKLGVNIITDSRLSQVNHPQFLAIPPLPPLVSSLSDGKSLPWCPVRRSCSIGRVREMVHPSNVGYLFPL